MQAIFVCCWVLSNDDILRWSGADVSNTHTAHFNKRRCNKFHVLVVKTHAQLFSPLQNYSYLNHFSRTFYSALLSLREKFTSLIWIVRVPFIRGDNIYWSLLCHFAFLVEDGIRIDINGHIIQLYYIRINPSVALAHYSAQHCTARYVQYIHSSLKRPNKPI